MIDLLQYIDELKKIKKLIEDQKPRYLITDTINDYITAKEKEVQSFEEWANEESIKDAGYSEEHIKQMTDPKHNQWGVAGEPKKKWGTLIHDSFESSILAHPGSFSGEKSQQKHAFYRSLTFPLISCIVIN